MAWNPDVLIQAIFAQWDADGSGLITVQELSSVLELLGFTKAEVSEAFQDADFNKDGKIDYAEFVSWLFGSAPPRAKKQVLRDMDFERCIPKPCHHGCGWTALAPYSTCCRKCKGPSGPHNGDCKTKNKLLPTLCKWGCGRPAFKTFDVCCTKCTGIGSHAKDCAEKVVAQLIDRTAMAVSDHTSDEKDLTIPFQTDSELMPLTETFVSEDKGSTSVPLCTKGCGRPALKSDGPSAGRCCIKCIGKVDQKWHCLNCEETLAVAHILDGTQCVECIEQGAARHSNVFSMIQKEPVDDKLQDASEEHITLCKWGCGRGSLGTDLACCPTCTGEDGTHSKDCRDKQSKQYDRGRRESQTSESRSLCELGCGRPSFGAFITCCTRCTGKDGTHSKDCIEKGGITIRRGSVHESPCSSVKSAMTREDVVESIRNQLAEWKVSDATQTSESVDEIISNLATLSGLSVEYVRLLWHTSASETRHVGGNQSLYVSLAEKHHGVKVKVVDLGQYSAERHNSCMFLACAAAVVERDLLGNVDVQLSEILGSTIVDSKSADIGKLVAEHKHNRQNTLGKVADVLRSAACETLANNKDFYIPFFHPVRSRRSFRDLSASDAYDSWVASLLGSTEGDQLVLLALSHICKMAIQTVQYSGYRVPLMDPLGASKAGYISYWGNDNTHWVWLQQERNSAS